MLEKLTDEQIAKQKDYVDKWVNITLDTEHCDKKEAEKLIAEIYKNGKIKKPNILWAKSPIEAVNIVADLYAKEEKREKTKEDIRQAWSCFFWVNFWSGYKAMWDYFYTECNVKEIEPYLPWIKISNHINGCIALHDVCVLSEKPVMLKTIDLNGRKELHCTTGPAVAYSDGFEIYALNGVKVPKWVVMTPAEQIDVIKINKESNVEIRRELVRKVGVERYMQKMNAKVLDKKDDYELLEVDLGLPEKAKALKMKNPSIDVWHVEFVGEECKTVQDAINFRAGDLIKGDENWNPEKLT